TKPLLRALAVGQVHHGADHAHGMLLSISDDVAAIKDVRVISVSFAKAVFIRPSAGVGMNDSVDASQDALPIIRMKARAPRFQAHPRLFRSITKKGLEAGIPPEGIVDDVIIQARDVRYLRHKSTTF